MKNLLQSMAKTNRKRMSVIAVLFLLVILLFCRFTYGRQQLARFGITWTFDKDYTTGQFANGDYWVVGPVTIIGINPPSIELNGRIINGSMVNPSPKLGQTQGYDSAMYGRYARPGHFDPGLNVARPNGRDLSASNPLVLQPGSSLVSTISTTETNGRTQLKVAAVLTVLDRVAPEGSFRPPYCGGDKAVRFNKQQLDYSLLASLKPVPGVPSLTTVERYFERVWLDHIPGFLGRSHHPLENMDDYDRDICTQEGIGALMLHLNFKNHRKETLLVRFVQLGIDNYGVIQDGGRENWLQDSGRKFPILFAGLMLNDPDMKNIGEKSGDYAYTAPYGPGNPPPDLIRFEEDEMTFYVTQADVDMTHGPQWNPDRRDAVQLPYEKEDIGLPEWGKVRLYDRKAVNKYWKTSYRQIIGQVYGGFVLAMHIMVVKDLWNHDALFDYTDRYMQVEVDWRQSSRFVENMWDVYRADYGSVWTMSPTLNIAAIGGSVTKYPDEATYALGETVVLSAIPNPGYEFTGWSRVSTKIENPLRIIMHANQSITAHFAAVEPAPDTKR
jgi:hypothetical protein